MDILLTNAWLGDRRGGTELYVLEVATALLARGHQPVAYSPVLGGVADDLGARGVAVIRTLADCPGPVDVIHGQHHPETMAALLACPEAPGVFVAHDARSWYDFPPRAPRLRRYLAVDQPNRERLVREGGIPAEQVELLLNFVDLARFKPRAPLPARPHRALLFSNYASERTTIPAVREACRRAGLELDVAGFSAGTPVTEAETLLPHYDLVFAKARAALEAMAVGAAVILCDFDGVGPMVTTADLERLRPLNFGFRTLTGALEPDVLLAQIERYDAAESERVAQRIRAEASLDVAVDRLVGIYEQVRAEHLAEPHPSVAEEQAAASAYLEWLNPFVKEREQTAAWAEQLLGEAQQRGMLIESLDATLRAQTTRAHPWLSLLDIRDRFLARVLRWGAGAR